MRAEIIVTPKKSVLDPQGEAVRRAIHGLGMDCVESARIGKFIELKISGKNADQTRKKLDQICHDLLSNPVIEDYQLELSTSDSIDVPQDLDNSRSEKKKKKDKKKKKKDKKKKKKDKKKKKGKK
jgi:phosphoribosylformylglycinamidine synthase PurS subunit